MYRHSIKPREGWQDIVTKDGLVYAITDHADGTKAPYWNEAGWYEFSMAEVEAIETATETLWGMCVEAVKWMATNLDDARLGLPAGSVAYAREALRRGDPDVYARFDLCVQPTGEIKMLEINGDTPTGLIETAVTQWGWLEAVMPDADQFNSLHERLVERWRSLAHTGTINGPVHFLWFGGEPTGEEEMTTHYMRDTAMRAGLATYGQPIEQVRWEVMRDETTTLPMWQGFVDAMGQPLVNAFKLYPWESMLGEEFAVHLLGGDETAPTQWIEPAWKMMLSTKGLLPVLWEMFPDSPYLLPAYWDEPRDLTDYVRKPLHGREGDNILIHVEGEPEQEWPGDYGTEGNVFQQWFPLPSLDGNRLVIGSWIVDGQAAGMLCRESDGPVTDYYSRVVPHAITDTIAPDPSQREAWLRERTEQPTVGL